VPGRVIVSFRHAEGLAVDHFNDGHDASTAVASDSPDLGRVLPMDETNAASLDKVRDILFGVQLRDVDRRFARLEERLVRETAELKDDLRKRLGALEQYFKGEVDALSERVRGEQDQRTDNVAQLTRELKDLLASFERRTGQIDEQLGRAQRELRQQLLEQHQHLTDEIVHKSDEVLGALTRESQQLRNDKTDRAALASLLTEMALRLTNEFRLPTGDGGGNG
jgi:DNA anti-recombination protein RmuC